MKNLRFVILVSLLVLGAAAETARADEVILKNGDRLSGTIIKMGEGSLTLKTSYAGEVKIDWKEVQGVTSAAPAKVQTLDGSIVTGVVTSPAPDRIVITGDQFGPSMAIPLTSIQAINPPPMVRYSGAFNLGGVIAKGNSDSKAINASLLYSLRADRHRFGVEGKYNYGEQSGRINVRNSLAQLTYDVFITKRVFFNTFALLEQDTLQDLNLRSTFGAGPGYQFIDTLRTKLSGTVGLAYVNEDWRTREDTSSTAGRWGVNFTTALIPDRLIFFHRQEGFYDFKEPNAWRLRADQGLRVPVYKQLAVNLEYDLRYNSNPAPGRKRTDHLYIVGLSYVLPE
jgi:putative salt-induced outer membrane protein YdiY